MVNAKWLLIDAKGHGLINGDKAYSFDLPPTWNLGELEYSFRQACVEYEIQAPLDDDELHRLLRNAVNEYGKKTLKESKQAETTETEPTLSEREQLILDAFNHVKSKYYFKTIDDNDEIRYYENGVFKPKGDILIKQELQKQFEGKATIGIVKEVLENVRRATYVPKDVFDANIKIQNLKNGVYNAATGEFIRHGERPPIIDGKEYLSLNQKNIMYNPRAKPRLFGQFLKQVLYPREIRTAIEAMAYSFHRDNPIEAYFILVGIGRNGKSVFTRLLTELLGRENVSNVPMSAIMSDIRFAVSDMEHKDANIDTELSAATIKDMAIIKRITTRQPFRIERKNQRAYDTTLTAKLWFNTNKIPETNDDSDAHYAREIIISFPNQFIDGKNADPNLIAKLTTQEELSGIFNVLMTALRTVLKHGCIYQQTKTIEERREKSKRATNPIKSFLTEGLAEDATVDDRVIKAEMYDAYQTYCKYYSLHFEPDNVFAGILKNTHKIQDGRQASGERKTFWAGVKVADWLLKEVSKVKGRQATLTA
jgi:putative DNA primase/helicase